jgi:hypothetical protein
VNDARTEMFDAVNRANLTIHAFDPTGLETLMDIPDFTRRRIIADRLERQDVLQTLAEKTGGTAVTNTNDPALFVPEAFRESESYYVLGFERSGAKANQPFHRIDVKVNRRGVDLRTRRGYFDAPDPARSPTASKTAVEALIAGALPDDGLPVRVVAEPFAAPGSFDPIVAVAASVTRGPDDARLAQVVGMVTAAFSLDGQSRGVDRQAFEIPPVSAADQATDWTFLSKLALKPGQYEIRVGLLPAGSSGGSVYLNIDVPDFGHAPLSLSGIMMSVQPDAPSVPAKLFDDLLPARPSTRRAFRSTERVTALVRTYQGGASALVPVHLRARIVGADGGILATVPVELDPSRFASRAAEDTFNLPLHGLSPGQYLLTIDAAAGAHIARRDVPFAVK